MLIFDVIFCLTIWRAVGVQILQNTLQLFCLWGRHSPGFVFFNAPKDIDILLLKLCRKYVYFPLVYPQHLLFITRAIISNWNLKISRSIHTCPWRARVFSHSRWTPVFFFKEITINQLVCTHTLLDVVLRHILNRDHIFTVQNKR